MSINLRPLTKYDANFLKVIDLYKKAFPGGQRIPTWILRYKLKNGKAGFNVIYAHGTWIGLIYITEYKDIVFIHFFGNIGIPALSGLRQQGNGFHERYARRKKNGFEY